MVPQQGIGFDRLRLYIQLRVCVLLLDVSYLNKYNLYGLDETVTTPICSNNLQTPV